MVFKGIFRWLVKKYKEQDAEFKAIGEQAWQEGYEIGLERARQEILEKRRQEGREAYWREARDWYERREAAFLAGLPFDEPPPRYDPAAHAGGGDGG